MYLPLYIDLRGKKVLIVGLGKVGKRRAEKLLKAGADVTVMDWKKVEVGKITKFIKQKLKPDRIPSLKEYFLVIVATDDKKLNAAIARKAKQEGCLVNRVDFFEDGNVIFPAVVETRAGVISFSTLGENPHLLKKIKEMLEHGISKH